MYALYPKPCAHAGGVFDAPCCEKADEVTLDHGIMIVGYGTEMTANGTAIDYWILRNRCVGASSVYACSLDACVCACGGGGWGMETNKPHKATFPACPCTAHTPLLFGLTRSLVLTIEFWTI